MGSLSNAPPPPQNGSHLPCCRALMEGEDTDRVNTARVGVDKVAQALDAVPCGQTLERQGVDPAELVLRDRQLSCRHEHRTFKRTAVDAQVQIVVCQTADQEPRLIEDPCRLTLSRAGV
ncbi:hypothetical protein GCM10027610_082130 [Dactylosporangium cerinum]